MAFDKLYDYRERLERSIRRIKGMPNASYALRFLEHLTSLGLSVARISKYAALLPVILRFFEGKDLAKVTREDVEKAVAWINQQPYAESTNQDVKHILKKLIQYVKCGSCTDGTPIPPESV
ncbi:hypothetical protein DRO53_00470 [Candidatus Bathyarchaeota archaeon]|nr:MAG: hypothetical protein DRO53_00470 [Candidatus Bathyarchaeota archaeon]